MLFAGKRGVILGIANDRSLAAFIAAFLKAEGAELAYNYLPDAGGRGLARVKAVVDPLGGKILLPCDVTQDESLKKFFSEVGAEMGTLDFVVHSIGFAPLEELRRPTVEVSRKGFQVAMDVSAYSFFAVCRESAALMPQGGSILTLTYYGGEKVVGGYNLMGVCKAALESAVQYIAYDLAPRNIRVNAVSAGAIKTLSSAVFGELLDLSAAMAPFGRAVRPDEVAKAAGYLLSDLASGTTGEVLHVDGGYHIMGSPGYAFQRMGITPGGKSKP